MVRREIRASGDGGTSSSPLMLALGWLIVAYLALLFVGTGLGLPRVFSYVPAWIGAAILIALACALAARGCAVPPLPSLGPALALIGWITLSLHWSADRFWGQAQVLNLLVPLSLFLSASLYASDSARRERFSLALVLVAAATAAYGLAVYAGWLPGHRAGDRLAAPFVNANHGAYAFEMAFPLAVALAFAGRSPGSRVAAGTCLVALGVAHMLAMSRGGWFGLAVGLLVLGGLAGRTAGRGRRFLFGAALVVAVWMVLRVSAEPILRRLEVMHPDPLMTYGESAASRPALWEAGLELAASRPILGHGVAGFDHSFSLVRRPGQYFRPFFTHNDYLEILVDHGLVGLFLLTLVGATWLLRVRAGLREDEDAGARVLRAGALGGCVAVLLHEVVEFGFVMPALTGLFACLAALAAIGPAGLRRPRPRAAIPAAVSLVLLGGVVWLAPSIRDGSHLRAAAQEALDSHELDRACHLADRACTALPDDPRVWRVAGEAYLERTELARKLSIPVAGPLAEEAALRLRQCLHLNGRAHRAHALLGRALFSAHPLEAVAVLEEGHRLDPHSPEEAVLFAYALLATGDEDRGKATLARILAEAESTGTRALQGLAESLVRIAPSVGGLEEMVPPAMVGTRSRLAAILERRGHLAEAARFYARLASGDREHGTTHLSRLASVRDRLGETTAALEALDEMIRVEPTFESHERKARLLERLGRMEEALATVEVALARSGPSARGLRRKASLLERLGRKREAARSLETAHGIAPDDLNLGLHLARLLPEERAVAHLEAMATRHPDRVKPLVALADLLVRMKRPHEAARTWVTAVGRKPSDLRLKDRLARQYMAVDFQHKAYRIWRKLEADLPHEAWPLQHLASAHLGEGEYRNALQVLTRLRGRFPDATFQGKPLSTVIPEVAARALKKERERAIPRE